VSRRRAVIFIQAGVSIALISYLFAKIDFASSISTLRNAAPSLLLASLAQLAILPLLGAWRWQVILRALGSELRFGPALRFVWIGIFFSQALPGSVGGDVVRIWLYWKSGAGHRVAINSVAIERIIMVLSLLILVAAMQPGLVARSKSLATTWLPFLLLAVAFGGTVILMLSDRLVQRFGRWRPFRAIAYLAADTRKTLLNPVVCLAVTLISILAFLNMAITTWFIALALKLPVTLTDCLVLIPIAQLASTIPISVGGWGVREGATVVLLATVGVAAADALSLSILWGLAGILISLPGVIIWLSGGYRRSDLSQAESLTSNEEEKALYPLRK
jgi:uncharacterized protein (TIRG00374 family)